MPLRYTVHPEHIRSLASMPLRYTVHPEHIRSLASMPLRYTVHPEHKKAPRLVEALILKYKMAVREGLFIAALFTPVFRLNGGYRRGLQYGLAALRLEPARDLACMDAAT